MRCDSYSWRCRNRHDCDTLTPPETTLTYLNDELERLMTLEPNSGAATSARTATSGARDRPAFLTGSAGDIDLCIDDLAGFNADVTAQVRVEYARQQQVRFETFLRDEGYDDVVANGEGNITGRKTWR